MTENDVSMYACCDPGAADEIDVSIPVLAERAEDGSAPAFRGEARLARRGLLKGAGALGVAAAAGAATGLLGSSGAAEAHGTSHVESASAAAPAIHGKNTASGGTPAAPAIGVLGDVPTPAAVTDVGQGVVGIAPGRGNGIFAVQQAESISGAGYTGQLGIAVQGVGCCGVGGLKPTWSTTIGAGVWGRAIISGGGTAPASLGVLGTKENPPFPAEGTPANTGVFGRAFVAGGAGVAARAPENADALRVHGRALFSSVGAGLIGEDKRSGTVAAAAVTASSHVSVTLTGNPGNHAAVEWVERNPGVGFTVHLNRNVDEATPFSYFIVEPTA